MKYVIIGASAAGINAAGLLRRLEPDSDIVIISRDKELYSRCMLHLKLAGKRIDEGISFIDDNFINEHRINWRGGENVVDINVDGKDVELESGGRVGYDKLLIASGASAFVPPVPNLKEANNVASFRNMEDVISLSAWGGPGRRAVIIGGGLVGMDAAVALLELGVEVTLVEMAGRILTIQLDDYAALKYARLLQEHGARVIVGAKVKGAIPNGDGGIEAVELADGQVLPCDFCVVSAGVAPNISFIKDGRINLTENKRAVAVDRRCRTSQADIFAAGDVTFLAPIWPEAVRQAEVAAFNMAGKDASLPDQDWAWTNSMNFFGFPTVSYGRTSVADPTFTEEIYIDGDVYKKVIHKDGILHGAIFQGDIDNCGVYLKLVKDQVPIGDIGKDLLRLSYADFFHQTEKGEFEYV